MVDSGKNRVKGSAHSSRSKQPKISNCVLVALQKVLDPTVNELFGRTLDRNQSFRFFILGPKGDISLPDMDDAALCDGRAPSVTSRILQEVFG
jgi:hypothetical protein